MPKGNDFHQVHDANVTDKKFRPEDEGIYAEEKQEFRSSEQSKKANAMSEKEFVTEQDKKAEG